MTSAPKYKPSYQHHQKHHPVDEEQQASGPEDAEHNLSAYASLPDQLDRGY